MSRFAATGLGRTSCPWQRAQWTLYWRQPSYSARPGFGSVPAACPLGLAAPAGGVSLCDCGGVMGGVAAEVSGPGLVVLSIGPGASVVSTRPGEDAVSTGAGPASSLPGVFGLHPAGP